MPKRRQKMRFSPPVSGCRTRQKTGGRKINGLDGAFRIRGHGDGRHLHQLPAQKMQSASVQIRCIHGAGSPQTSPLTSPVLNGSPCLIQPGSQLRRHIRYGLHQCCRDFQPFPDPDAPYTGLQGGNGHAARENGIVLPNSAPSGSRMSPSRSGEGVDAIPVITPFILTEGFHRQQGTGPFKSHISLLKIKKTAAAVHDGYRVSRVI